MSPEDKERNEVICELMVADLQVHIGSADDGGGLVIEAFSECSCMAKPRAIATLLADALRDSDDPTAAGADDAEIGRLTRELVAAYAKRCAEADTLGIQSALTKRRQGADDDHGYETFKQRQLDEAA